MGGRRKKKRTHVPIDEEAAAKIPKSFVVKAGVVGKSVHQLVLDVRRLMEPNTASRLKERKGNKLKDFVHVAAQLNVSHLMIFSRTDAGINLRIGRIPRGPTISFKVMSYVLSKDVHAVQLRPKSPGSDFKSSPLVVLNNFNDGSKQVKLMATMLQNLFPPINVNTIKLTQARRVVLFNLDPETQLLDVRHYSIDVKATGISKSVKSIVQTNVPDLTKFDDISDYVLRGAFASESDVEDAGESTVVLPQRYVGRGNSGKQASADQRAVKLTEIGPRMQLRLVKIHAGLCDGEVLYHSHVTKSQEEIAETKRAREERDAEKARRRAEQEKNVERKQRSKKGDADATSDADDEGDDGDDDNDDGADNSESDNGQAPRHGDDDDDEDEEEGEEEEEDGMEMDDEDF